MKFIFRSNQASGVGPNSIPTALAAKQAVGSLVLAEQLSGERRRGPQEAQALDATRECFFQGLGGGGRSSVWPRGVWLALLAAPHPANSGTRRVALGMRRAAVPRVPAAPAVQEVLGRMHEQMYQVLTGADALFASEPVRRGATRACPRPDQGRNPGGG